MQALPARCIIAQGQRGRRGCPGVGERKTDQAGAGRPGIKTFLIADVRGYTLFTQQRGDEAAAKLAARFAEIAREAVDDHGGSVIELRGDEALAVFDSPRQAIRAAPEPRSDS